jgi:ABC-type phosphate transport system permease subunit
MTTVGYGDFVPQTSSGALLGYIAMLTGVLSVALPISVLSNTFASKYEQFTQETKVCLACTALLTVHSS